MSQIIFGITGTLGAGKGTVTEILCSEFGYTSFSVRQFLEEEIARRGLPNNRDVMTRLANELREEHGASYIVEQLYHQAEADGRFAVIESIRTTGEVDFLRKLPRFKLLAVDAEIKLRYERVCGRGSSTDRISFEKFREDELRESTSLEADKQNLVRCIKLADYLFLNNGTIAELRKEVLFFVDHFEAAKAVFPDTVETTI
jgi:dephospho-CoA kinase